MLVGKKENSFVQLSLRLLVDDQSTAPIQLKRYRLDTLLATQGDDDLQRIRERIELEERQLAIREKQLELNIREQQFREAQRNSTTFEMVSQRLVSYQL